MGDEMATCGGDMALLERSLEHPRRRRFVVSDDHIPMTDYGGTRRKAMMAKFDIDRRKRKIRRMWYAASEEIGAFLWLVVAFMVATMAWLCFYVYR